MTFNENTYTERVIFAHLWDITKKTEREREGEEGEREREREGERGRERGGRENDGEEGRGRGREGGREGGRETEAKHPGGDTSNIRPIAAVIDGSGCAKQTACQAVSAGEETARSPQHVD